MPPSSSVQIRWDNESGCCIDAFGGGLRLLEFQVHMVQQVARRLRTLVSSSKIQQRNINARWSTLGHMN